MANKLTAADPKFIEWCKTNIQTDAPNGYINVEQLKPTIELLERFKKWSTEINREIHRLKALQEKGPK